VSPFLRTFFNPRSCWDALVFLSPNVSDRLCLGWFKFEGYTGEWTTPFHLSKLTRTPRYNWHSLRRTYVMRHIDRTVIHSLFSVILGFRVLALWNGNKVSFIPPFPPGTHTHLLAVDHLYRRIRSIRRDNDHALHSKFSIRTITRFASSPSPLTHVTSTPTPTPHPQPSPNWTQASPIKPASLSTSHHTSSHSGSLHSATSSSSSSSPPSKASTRSGTASHGEKAILPSAVRGVGY
jgi:hypothetical protein